MLTLLLAYLLSHPPVIALAVTPLVCRAPCDVRITVTVEPHSANRWFILQLDGTMFQGTMKQLDGDHSPKTQPAIWFKDLPAGEYEIIAVVYRNVGRAEAGRVSATVIVQ